MSLEMPLLNMRFFKGVIRKLFLISILIFFGAVLFYKTLLLLFLNSISLEDHKRISESILLVRFDRSIRSIVNIFEEPGEEVVLLRSRNDIISDSHTLNEAYTQEGLLLDYYKGWRKAEIVDDDKRIQVRYKLHGSIIDFQNPSFSIKYRNELGINQVKKYIRFSEFGIAEHIINSLGNKYGLYGMSLGDFELFNDGMGSGLYYSYTDSISNLDGENVELLKLITFKDSYIEWHASELDEISYNIDIDSISNKEFELWTNFINGSLQDIHYDSDYLGTYFALLELQGITHDVVGNNSKTIVIDSTVFPVWRSEGAFKTITPGFIRSGEMYNADYFVENERPLFEHRLNRSLWRFKEFYRDSNIINRKNNVLAELVENKENYISMWDSLEVFLQDKLFYTSKNYLRDSYVNRYEKSVLENNLRQLEFYLFSGFTIISYDGRSYRINSTSNTELSLLFENGLVKYMPLNYVVDRNGLLRPKAQEVTFDYHETGKLIELQNSITKDTLIEGLDYHILYVVD